MTSTILIVDDEPGVRSALSGVLRDEGYNVEAVESGESCLERLTRGAVDLIVLDVVSHGAEIIAEGHIHVYAPLRGRAVAGASGNIDARILCTCMEPELICIAGIYRTAEQSLPDDLIGKPAQVRLAGGKLLVEALALK